MGRFSGCLGAKRLQELADDGAGMTDMEGRHLIVCAVCENQLTNLRKHKASQLRLAEAIEEPVPKKRLRRLTKTEIVGWWTISAILFAAGSYFGDAGTILWIPAVLIAYFTSSWNRLAGPPDAAH